MAKAYKFDDEKPKIGEAVSAFKTLRSLKQFVSIQGGLYGNMKYWEIDGNIVEDSGGQDGLKIVVRSVRQIN